MTAPINRKIDPKRVSAMLRKGKSKAAIARELGVSRQAVDQHLIRQSAKKAAAPPA